MDDPPKRRRIHMPMTECAALSVTEDGSKALTDPLSIPKSSKDPNRGLYPCLFSKPSTTAVELPNITNGQNPCASSSIQQTANQFISSIDYNTAFNDLQNNNNKDIFQRKKILRKFHKQRNSLFKYFSSAEKQSVGGSSSAAIDLSLVEESSNESDVFLQSLLQKEIKSKDTCDAASLLEDKSDMSNNVDESSSSSDCDIYGLLGSGNLVSTCETEAGPDYFQTLPTHIFELILCHLPFLDLMLNLKRVAKYWNRVISNDKFLIWKKKYFKLKCGKMNDQQKEIQALCLSLKMNNVRDCLPGLIKYMKGFNLTPSSDMIKNLKCHSKYTWAENLIEGRAADCTKGGVPNPWCIIAALVVISETMWDVYNIFKCLLHVNSQCPIPDILECLYCVATFLYYLQQTYSINHGLHYRVYYAIYTFENKWRGKTDDIRALQNKVNGQQCILRYSLSKSVKFTHEQMRILNHPLKQGDVVKIVAFAGTGKTSTLIEYTTLHPHLKFLNVMYNKSVCDHAKSCFPPNVECRTAHSLAWAAVGRRYTRKLSFNIKPLDIIPSLEKLPEGTAERYRYASCVLTTVQSFTATADDFITTAHVPYSIADEVSGLLGHQERMNIANDAEHLWKQMIDLDSPVRITHDVYLKLYQLSHPNLSQYDCILIDEAQDCNGAMLDILLSQSCPKILVGDPNQQIYAFRGATNALSGVQCSQVYYLTQSFRFGPQIAYIASCALEVLKKIDNNTLVGGTHAGSVGEKIEGQLAIIARSNITLFNEAIRLCCTTVRRRDEPENVFGCFAGGIKGYNLDQIIEIQKLMSLEDSINKNDNSAIKDKFIKRFSSFAALRHYAENVKDAELLGKIKLVLQHHDKIPKYIETIKQKCTYSLDMANIVFTTAHKSKGLEFDTVSLADDFTVGNIPYPSGNIDMSSLLEDEFNILYVAITRAKKSLCIPICVYYMLLGAQEKFEYFMSRKTLEAGNPSIQCFICGLHVLTNNNSPLVLARKKLTFSNSNTLPGGPMCTKCATNPVFTPIFPNSNFALQMTRPLEDFSHESTSQFVGPVLSREDREREESRKSPLVVDNPYIALRGENFGDDIIFLI